MAGVIVIHLSYANKLSWPYFRSKLLLTVNFWRRPEKLIYIYMYADWMNEWVKAQGGSSKY